MSELEIIAVGAQALVEDSGRPGWAHLGVTTSGAADRGAWRLANRLLGNAEDCAAVEVLMGGLQVRCAGSDDEPGVQVVVTGAPLAAQVRTADGSVRTGVDAYHRVVELRVGDVLELGSPRAGLRSYLGVRGGIATEEVLGSRSCDPTTGIGGTPLQAGDRLPLGTPGAGDLPHADPMNEQLPGEHLELDAWWGPRHDWFTEESRAAFAHGLWEVTEQQDRVGVRLAGEPLHRSNDTELPSEGLVRGAVQVPPNGQPLVFCADHPTTGGYPVICVVADTDALAQARPGTRLRFRLRSVPERAGD